MSHGFDVPVPRQRGRPRTRWWRLPWLGRETAVRRHPHCIHRSAVKLASCHEARTGGRSAELVVQDAQSPPAEADGVAAVLLVQTASPPPLSLLKVDRGRGSHCRCGTPCTSAHTAVGCGTALVKRRRRGNPSTFGVDGMVFTWGTDCRRWRSPAARRMWAQRRGRRRATTGAVLLPIGQGEWRGPRPPPTVDDAALSPAWTKRSRPKVDHDIAQPGGSAPTATAPRRRQRHPAGANTSCAHRRF